MYNFIKSNKEIIAQLDAKISDIEFYCETHHADKNKYAPYLDAVAERELVASFGEEK